MYRLMIVDDEVVIRDGLRKNICWKEIDVELVGEAGDGIEAIALFEEFRPNIVIMDINLPFINGLDVANEILALDPDVKIIILTGHNDFEYAQKALKVGAFDLQLKPMEPDSICCTIKKACDSLESIKNEKLRSQSLQKLLEEGIPLLREKYIISLLNSNITADDEQIREKLTSLGINLFGTYYNVAVLIPAMHDNKHEIDEMMLLSVKAIVEENVIKSDSCTFLYCDNLFRMVLLFGYSESDANDKFDTLFTGIRDKIKFYLNMDVSIGVGKETRFISEISSSYISACEALNYVNIYGRNNVVNIRNVNTIEKSRTIYNGKDMDTIITCFKTGNFEEFNDKFNNLINLVISMSLGNLEPVKRMCIELMAAVFRACDEIEIQTGYLFQAEGPYARILGFSNILDLKSWVLKICGELLNSSVEKRYRKVNRVVELAKRYIQDNHHNEELSLRTVCEQVGLSNSYFCQLFYQETGKHFSDYINMVRVEAAKKHLDDSILKIYEIAYAVGYNNPKYFNMIFKKITGITPLEYRNSYKTSS